MPAAATPSSQRTLHARGLFAGLARSYDVMGRWLSFWQDPRWRRFLASRVAVPAGGRVLDVATGTGAVAMELERRWPGRVIGLDQSEPMVREGVRRVEQAGLDDRTSFVLGQAERLPFGDGVFEGLTFTYLLRYVDDPAGTLAELARVLKAGGTMAGLEFHVPGAPWWPLWWVHTRLVMPGAGRLVSRSWYEAGRFLGPSVSSFYDHHPLTEQVLMWKAAGMGDIHTRVMSLGGAVVTWGRKAAANGG